MNTKTPAGWHILLRIVEDAGRQAITIDAAREQFYRHNGASAASYNTVANTLRKMDEAGLVKSTPEPKPSGRGGPLRVTYTITRHGRASLQRMRRAIAKT